MICDVATDTALDIILTLVFVVFAFEWFVLSLLDFGYLFGFFWVMDLVGTVSMFFDISYLLADSAEEPLVIEQKIGSGRAQEQTALLRAARTAKLGARAGRISRVVKVMLLFLWLWYSCDVIVAR